VGAGCLSASFARIQEALAILRSRASSSTSAAQVAAAIGLSTPRFLHLFSEHVGTSFRRYRLWSPMLRVAQSVAAGQTLTRAASDAGFASPSHFSDAFRDLFGSQCHRTAGATDPHHHRAMS
jgi:methylphosphotriester-DNA--protein-cysteine methyltransferase